MRRKSITPTTVVIVALLLGGLFFVSSLVNPKPAGPPPETPAADTAQGKQIAKDVNKQVVPDAQGHDEIDRLDKETRRKMYEKYKNASKTPKTAINPTAMDVTPDYFTKFDMGKAGTKEVNDAVARAKAEIAKSAEKGRVPLAAPAVPIIPAKAIPDNPANAR